MDPKAKMFEFRHREIAERDGSWYPDDFQVEVVEALASRVARVATPPGRLIEFGCGTGENVRAFAVSGWDAMGVDVSKTAIEAAKKRSGGMSVYLCANLSEPVLAEIEPADVVLDGHCYHFQLREQRPIFLSNVKRCLKPGGWLVVNSMIGSPKGDEIDFDPVSRISRMGEVETNYYATLEELEKELEQASFIVKDREVASGTLDIAVLWAKLATTGRTSIAPESRS